MNHTITIAGKQLLVGTVDCTMLSLNKVNRTSVRHTTSATQRTTTVNTLVSNEFYVSYDDGAEQKLEYPESKFSGRPGHRLCLLCEANGNRTILAILNKTERKWYWVLDTVDERYDFKKLVKVRFSFYPYLLIGVVLGIVAFVLKGFDHPQDLLQWKAIWVWVGTLLPLFVGAMVYNSREGEAVGMLKAEFSTQLEAIFATELDSRP